MSKDNDFFSEFANALSDEDIYKLMDIISIEDASALIAGVSPNNVYHGNDGHGQYAMISIRPGNPYNAEEVFSISLKSLKHAIKSGSLKAQIVATPHTDFLTQDDLTKD